MYITSLFFLLILAGTSSSATFNKRRGLRTKTHINSNILGRNNDDSDSDNEDDTKVTDKNYFAKKELNRKLKGAQTREKLQRVLNRGKYARIEVDDFFAGNNKHYLNKQRRNQEVNSSDQYDSGDGDNNVGTPSSMPSFVMSLPLIMSSSEDEEIDESSSSSDDSSNRQSNQGKGCLKKNSKGNRNKCP